MAFAPELLDELLKDYKRPEDMLGPGGIFETAEEGDRRASLWGPELEQHLAEEAAQPAPPRNHRNGTTPKTVQTDSSALRLAVPRDRAGTFEPQLVKKHQRAATEDST